jgi:hypothetical protein
VDNWFLVLLGIGVWRVTMMIGNESGPLNVFMRLRANLARGQKHMGGMYDMVACHSCLSVWMAMIPAAFLAQDILTFFILTFILSGIAVLISSLLDRIK